MSYIKKYCDGWDDGYASGLDAAREAVAALDIGRDVRFSVDVQADARAHQHCRCCSSAVHRSR